MMSFYTAGDSQITHCPAWCWVLKQGQPQWANPRILNIHSSPPGQNGRHFADDIFRCIFVNEKFYISIKISLKFVPKGPNDNYNPALVKIMAWRWIGDKPLSESMLTRFTDALHCRGDLKFGPSWQAPKLSWWSKMLCHKYMGPPATTWGHQQCSLDYDSSFTWIILFNRNIPFANIWERLKSQQPIRFFVIDRFIFLPHPIPLHENRIQIWILYCLLYISTLSRYSQNSHWVLCGAQTMCMWYTNLSNYHKNKVGGHFSLVYL